MRVRAGYPAPLVTGPVPQQPKQAFVPPVRDSYVVNPGEYFGSATGWRDPVRPAVTNIVFPTFPFLDAAIDAACYVRGVASRPWNCIEVDAVYNRVRYFNDVGPDPRGDLSSLYFVPDWFSVQVENGPAVFRGVDPPDSNAAFEQAGTPALAYYAGVAPLRPADAMNTTTNGLPVFYRQPTKLPSSLETIIETGGGVPPASFIQTPTRIEGFLSGSLEAGESQVFRVYGCRPFTIALIGLCVVRERIPTQYSLHVDSLPTLSVRCWYDSKYESLQTSI